MAPQSYLAFDFGAESGRGILGTIQEDKLNLEELHRFPTGMLKLHGSWHWNIFRLFEEIKKGMTIAAARSGDKPVSMAVDTWGVDFGLLGSDGRLLGLPFAYRDNRTDGTVDAFSKLLPLDRLYEKTGIQTLPFNTLFQLYAMVRQKSPLLKSAEDLLFVPDMFNYLLTGEKLTEFSFATTSQLYNPVKKGWDESLFQLLGIPVDWMQKVITPGSVIGHILPEILDETGLDTLPVIACASHDTGSAVASVPAEGENWAYISSGTWSLMGVELDEPNLSRKAMEYNYTNEGGVESTFRFLKNICGLWLVQQCKKSWMKEKEYSYQELTEMAASAPAFGYVIDPDDSAFINPPDMPEAVQSYCRQSEQAVPQSKAEIVRCALESLALKYTLVKKQLEELNGKSIDKIHIVGGGSKNTLLCQMTADATDVPVIAGPAEATAIGNILVQAMAMGQLSSLEEIRAVVKASVRPRIYEPNHTDGWDEAFGKFMKLV